MNILSLEITKIVVKVMKKIIKQRESVGFLNFRGEIGVILVNLSNEEQTIEPGERIAQLVVSPVEKAEIREIEKVPQNTERGDGAYGSSGRF